MLGGAVKIMFALREAELVFRRFDQGGVKMRQAVEKGDVGDVVFNAGAAGADAVFDAHMRFAVFIETNQRPVPAPDGAVVQAQMPQAFRRLLIFHRQHHRIVLQVFCKTFEQGFARIAHAEADALDGAVGGVFKPAGGHGLLEHRDAGFLPQLFAKQKRRIAADCHHRRRQHDGGVVVAFCQMLRRLDMNLQRGGGGFQHHVAVLGLQMLVADNVERNGATLAQPQHLFVERAVAIEGGNIVQRQVFIFQCGQNADAKNIAAQLFGVLFTLRPQLQQAVVEVAQHVAAEGLRRHIEFDIEFCQLRAEQRVARLFQKRFIVRAGLLPVVDQPGFQLITGHRWPR